LQRRKEEDERRRLAEKEIKLQKEREIKEGRQLIKNEKDLERQRMREDILKKKREKMKEGGGDIKVEIVGLPDFMVVEETTNRPPNNLKEIK
jgi:hypothetical protein